MHETELNLLVEWNLVHETELNLLVEWSLVHGTSFSRTESGAWHCASHFGITKRLKL